MKVYESSSFESDYDYSCAALVCDTSTSVNYNMRRREWISYSRTLSDALLRTFGLSPKVDNGGAPIRIRRFANSVNSSFRSISSLSKQVRKAGKKITINYSG